MRNVIAEIAAAVLHGKGYWNPSDARYLWVGAPRLGPEAAGGWGIRLCAL